MAEIDNSSFVLGELTGQMKALIAKVDKIDADSEIIKRSLSHQKAKQAGLSATVAIVFTFIYSLFKDGFKG